MNSRVVGETPSTFLNRYVIVACVKQIYQLAMRTFNNIIKTQCVQQHFFREENGSLTLFYFLKDLVGDEFDGRPELPCCLVKCPAPLS
jgi:hypothetical protein